MNPSPGRVNRCDSSSSGSSLVVGANVALAGMLAIPAVLVWALATSVVMWRSAR